MGFDYSQFETGPTVSPFAHLTRSALAQRLMELEAAGKGESVRLAFEGDADKAHIKTRSIRLTMARHGFKLCYKREPGYLIVWAVKDPSINRTLYITKPRRKLS